MGGEGGGEGGRWWGTSPLPPLVVFRSFVPSSHKLRESSTLNRIFVEVKFAHK